MKYFFKNQILLLDQKQYITCLVKTEYADESESMKLYLFENRTTKNLFVCLDLIEYEK